MGQNYEDNLKRMKSEKCQNFGEKKGNYVGTLKSGTFLSLLV